MQYQDLLFNRLKERMGSQKKHLIDKVQEALGLKKSTAYKRINGSSAMSVDELILLSKAMNFSLDDVFSRDKHITFKHPFVNEEENRKNFIHQFDLYLAPLDRKDGNSLTFLANELPLFYYFNHPHIFHFTVSVWNHLHWADSRLEIDSALKYDEQLKGFRDLTRKRISNIDVVEVWNSNMLNNLFQQIIFSITIRAFKSAPNVTDLLNDIELLINSLKKATEVKNERVTIYLNEFGNYLNMVTYNSKSMKATFLGVDYPKFIVSENENFYLFATDWINKIKRRSVLISGEGYQYQELFFRKMETDFTAFKEKVYKLISIYYE